jgi:hypothetical protein
VSAIEIKGLDALRKRLEAAADPRRFKETLRAETEAMAAEARRQAPAELAQSIEVRDVSRGTTPAYTVGTSHPLGRILEFGTLRRPASRWLWPVFRARLPAIKDNLRKLASAASKTNRAGV